MLNALRCSTAHDKILILVTLHASALVSQQMFALLLLSGLAAPGGKGLWSDMFNPCEYQQDACCHELAPHRMLA